MADFPMPHLIPGGYFWVFLSIFGLLNALSCFIHLHPMVFMSSFGIHGRHRDQQHIEISQLVGSKPYP